MWGFGSVLRELCRRRPYCSKTLLLSRQGSTTRRLAIEGQATGGECNIAHYLIITILFKEC